MAKLYGEIAAKSLLTLDKSFARANGQPLDASEVYYSLDAAKTYAATAQAYIGQKIVVIEDGVVSHYSVEDTAGTLKELGSKPVADGTTIAIGEDGKITLANIADENKTGTYNAVLVNGELTWVKPSSTTVEGLNDLITALTKRVDDAEADIDALEEAIGVASKAESSEGAGDAVAATGLHKLIEDEASRAKDAERALGERIDDIDFVDTTEMTDAINAALVPYAKTAELPVKGVAADDNVLAITDALISATVALAYDSEAKEIKLTGKNGADLGSVDATPFIKDGMLDNVEYSEATNSLIFTWNTSAGKSEDVVVLSDIIEPYTAGVGLELSGNEFAIKLADGSESYLTVSADGLKLTGIADAIATAKAGAIADAEGKIQTATDNAAADATQKANKAKEDAIADAASKYATTTALSDLETAIDERLDTLEAINHDEFATKEELKTTDDKAVSNANSITNLTSRLDGIVAQGGEPNTINTIKVNGVAQAIDSEKAVDIAVPTKFSEITDDSGFGDRITANTNAAAEAKTLAQTAKDNAGLAQADVDALEGTVGTLSTAVDGHTASIADHLSRIVVLENADKDHAAEYAGLQEIVTGHTTTLATKADKSALDSAIADIAKNTTAITTLNETTVPALQQAIGTKANAADVYTISQIDAITGEVAEGKTLVQMIADAKSEASYDDTAIKNSIDTNTAAINVLNSDAETEGSVLAIAKAEAKTAAKAEVATLVGAAPEALDTLEEVAAWISDDVTGTTALVTRVTVNEEAIAAINNENTGILAVAKQYTDDALAAIPAATAEVLGLVKYDDKTIKKNASGQLYAAEISTDILVQGTQELILNGGSATV